MQNLASIFDLTRLWFILGSKRSNVLKPKRTSPAPMIVLCPAHIWRSSVYSPLPWELSARWGPLKRGGKNFAHVSMSSRWGSMQILVSIGTVGASPQIGEILGLPLCDFLDCPVRTVLSCPYLFSCAQVEPLDRFSRFMAQTTCFCARKCLSGLER